MSLAKIYGILDKQHSKDASGYKGPTGYCRSRCSWRSLILPSTTVPTAPEYWARVLMRPPYSALTALGGPEMKITDPEGIESIYDLHQ